MRVFVFFFWFKIFLFCSFTATAQVSGCIDTRASNYNPEATINDGSCIYINTSIALKDYKKATLPEAINEISGIIFFNGKLYGHNDSGGQPSLYEIDTTNGLITKTITLEGASNTDWEDVAQDDKYIYVGDFGNNENGNRNDLAIYKFPKVDITNSTGAEVVIPSSDIQVIRFSYEDQNDFIRRQPNSTNFDCEAFFYNRGQLHLFTKNWTGSHTVHYVLNASISSGIQTAIRKDSLDTEGTLITAAAMLNDTTILLLGYEVTGIPSGNLWIISEFSDVNRALASGNKRKVGLGLILGDATPGIGQIEGLAVAGKDRVFITSEYFKKSLPGLDFTIPQSLYALSITGLLPKHNNPNATTEFRWKVSPTPFSDKLLLNLFCEKDRLVTFSLHDISGKELLSEKVNCVRGENKYELNNLSALRQAVYFVTAKSDDDLLVKKVMRR